jgi:riboflavin synthase
MYTGIITDIGTVTQVTRNGVLRARIATRPDTVRTEIGASIACDGVCLTIRALGPDWFEAEASDETLSVTTVGGWQPGTTVNLERPLRPGDELGGHIVLGHVDGVVTLLQVTPEGGSHRMRFAAPPELARFIAPKGSVTLNGTSLTVNEVEGDVFGVNIIPHTFSVTGWSAARPGDRANLEVDVLARYVARLQTTDNRAH